jgi:hypothetical protein
LLDCGRDDSLQHPADADYSTVGEAMKDAPINLPPMYCAVCGLGYGEFMACEEPDCGPLMTGLEINILCDFELLAKGQQP